MAETSYLIDTYQEQASAEVLERAQWGADAYAHYGMAPDSSVIQGTRALDMYGIDARLPDNRHSSLPLDLDVVVSDAELTRLSIQNPPSYTEDDIEDIFAPAQLHLLQLTKGDFNLDATSLMYGGKEGDVKFDYAIARSQSQVVSVLGRSGLYRVMNLYAAAAWKLSAGSPKDILGVTYAHVSAHRQEHEVVATPAWKKMARQAINQAEQLKEYHKPDWLTDPNDLRSHPAFAALD